MACKRFVGSIPIASTKSPGQRPFLARTFWWIHLSGTVTELDATAGRLVRVLSASKLRFFGPDAISSDGTHVWVTHESVSSVDELNAATGALVRILKDDNSPGKIIPHRFCCLGEDQLDGTSVWVTNYYAGSVTGSPAG
jgi:hypothetical protein